MRFAIFAGGLWAALLATGALAQSETPCPGFVPEGATCYNGQDSNGAYYWIAKPRTWNGVLVVHAHGGPRTPPPTIDSPLEDLKRWVITLQEGYAWAGSSFRRGGYGMTMAAEDTDSVRRIAIAKLGSAKRTILHGQSWGGGVAARAIELFGSGTTHGKPNYDVVMLTSGVLAGNSLAYNFRADLRAVYQYYCRNHPRSDEPQYPVWMGLPADARLTGKELDLRVDECTGLGLPAKERTAGQKRNLANILSVLRIPERSLRGHLNWSTVLFQDIVHRRLGGRNPFSNAGVRYSGSDDDPSLNKGVARFEADPAAAAEFARDGDMTGRIPVPVVTLHAIDDPVAFVEHEAAYRAKVDAAGAADRLVQTFTRETEHSYLSSPEYAALFEATLRWVDSGEKPSPQGIAASCQKHAARYEGGCHFDVNYRPAPLDTRQYPRAARAP